MTLRHLHIFQVVCEFNSITIAAEKLNMTQPAVSIAMKELENFYNTKLFERMNRRIYITESGNTLLKYATSMLTDFQESIDLLRNDKLNQHCHIGVNASFAETHLAELLKNFYQINPETELKIDIYNNDTILHMVKNNELDFAIMDKQSDDQNVHSTLLYHESMIIAHAFPSKSKISIQELSEKKLLLREKGSGARYSIDSVFAQHGLIGRPYIESTSTLSLVKLAQLGLGYIIMPKEIIAKYIKDKQLYPITLQNDAFDRFYYLVIHNHKYITNITQLVIDFFINELK